MLVLMPSCCWSTSCARYVPATCKCTCHTAAGHSCLSSAPACLLQSRSPLACLTESLAEAAAACVVELLLLHQGQDAQINFKLTPSHCLQALFAPCPAGKLQPAFLSHTALLKAAGKDAPGQVAHLVALEHLLSQRLPPTEVVLLVWMSLCDSVRAAVRACLICWHCLHLQANTCRSHTWWFRSTCSAPARH